MILAGDTLFAGSIGRTDLPGGDTATLLRSVRDKLLTRDDAAHVLPGHGPTTTIGRERASNPFLQDLRPAGAGARAVSAEIGAARPRRSPRPRASRSTTRRSRRGSSTSATRCWPPQTAPATG